MGYLAYIFDMFFNIATSIKIPIPISEKLTIHLSIFSILIGIIVLGIIIWFITRLLNFEINWSFSQLGQAQNNNFKSNNKYNKSTDKEYVRTMKN